MFGKQQEQGRPLERALKAASELKAGSWASVEALAMLAIECRGRQESRTHYDTALRISLNLTSGSWESIRALIWLSRAGEAVGEAGL